MLRLVTGALIGALIVAPLGFGEAMPPLVVALARLLFGVLTLACLLLVALGALWGRRWALEK